MPRHFSSDEISRLEKRFLTEGRRLFEALGFKKASVDKIVEAVGVAKGSFYNFYASKEVLFFDVLMDLELELHKEMIADLRRRLKRDRFVPAFRDMLKTQFEKQQTHPLLSIILDFNFLMKIYQKIDPRRMNRADQIDTVKFEDYISMAKNSGYRLQATREAFFAFMRSQFVLSSNRNLIGNGADDNQNMILETGLNYLFREIEDVQH